MDHQGTKNLIPQNKKTKEEQREIARKGGIASGIAKRNKKILSEIYKEYLKSKGKDIEHSIDKALKRGDTSTVSMLRELREGTEGSKQLNFGNITININDPE